MNTRVYSYQPPVSRTYTYKKVTKPLLERRRRARISKCLDELRTIVTNPSSMSGESVNRLEKADILELTVDYLNKMITSTNRNRFQEGFDECAAEACHYLETSNPDPSIAERLVEHLETCTGPISIQVPQYKLSFSPVDNNKSSYQLNTPNSMTLENPPSLLMAASKMSNQKQQTKDLKTSDRWSPYSSASLHCSESDVRRIRETRVVSSFTPSSSMWRPW